ncbi:MAG: hypothetical protein Q9211_003853 [Gyalolechia sp. 1 TL-2023]
MVFIADANIATLLRTLAFSPEPELNQAELLGFVLTAGGRVPHLQRSSHLGTFRRITVFFYAGGITPTTPVSQQYFAVGNDFPRHWDAWGNPKFYEFPPMWLVDREFVQWARVSALMPIWGADQLLKKAGFRGEYEKVFLHQMKERALQYCFGGLGAGPEARQVVVEVLTGEVKEVDYDCALDPRGLVA